MKYTLAFLGMIGCLLLISDDYTVEVQPEPLRLDSTTTIQPILENANMELKFQYIRTLKVYYKDKLPKQIDFRKGEPLETYCSDLTYVNFYTETDSVFTKSFNVLNCKILAIVNLTEKDTKILLSKPIKKITIENNVTENKYIYYVNTDYFQKLLK